MLTSESLYLELLKKTLSYTLWEEPPIPINMFNYNRSLLKRIFISIINKALERTKIGLVIKYDFSKENRINGKIWPRYADTMIGIKRLNNLQECLEDVLNKIMEGDFIETGVWRGGACILMNAILTIKVINDRKVYVADSFEGLPKPDENKYPDDKGDTHYKQEFLSVSLEEVKNNFKKYDLLNENVVFLKGWFKDTLPLAPINKLSILRLDGDMYSSTIEVLETLYPKLVSGGYCIVDDYALDGCKKAVDNFRTKNQITDRINQVDWSGIYWQKE